MTDSRDSKPVLVLGEEPRVAITIARSLHRRGIPVDVAAISPSEPALASRAIRRFVRLPSYRHEPDLFNAALLDLIEAGGHDMLIPSSDGALAALAALHTPLSALLHVGCPPPHIVNRVLDKDITLETAARIGVPTPETYRMTGGSELDERGGSWRFPIVAKPRNKTKSGTFKMRRFETLEELREACILDRSFGDQCLFQQYCPGEGVGIETLMHHGEPLVLFQHRRIRELPSTGGVSVVAVSEPVDVPLAEHAVRLLRALEWEGVAMVEFRQHPMNGTAALMEVNGRYWGSLSLSCLAGLDFPWYEWQLAHQHRPEVPSTYWAGMRMRWTSGSLRRLHALWADGNNRSVETSGMKELRGFVTDLLPPTRDALWSIRDPAPALVEMARTVKTLAVGEIKKLLKSVLPEQLVSMRGMSRRLGPRAGRVYLKCSVRRALRLKDDRVPPSALEGRNVLFICHGNIIRSPMAAALLRRSLVATGHRSFTIESAGLHASPLNGPDHRALQVAAELGVSLQQHKAQPLTREMVQRADVIFVMDYLNEADLLARYPEAEEKLFLLGACSMGASDDAEIVDPYHGDVEDIRRCYDRLRKRIDDLAQRFGGGTEPDIAKGPAYAGAPRPLLPRASRIR
jgi:protein-tyrosine-phosphatase/predicted ATP-grasp superfamily ATP-dependent carboligase